jgi:hypothetical protein
MLVEKIQQQQPVILSVFVIAWSAHTRTATDNLARNRDTKL